MITLLNTNRSLPWHTPHDDNSTVVIRVDITPCSKCLIYPFSIQPKCFVYEKGKDVGSRTLRKSLHDIVISKLF